MATLPALSAAAQGPPTVVDIVPNEGGKRRVRFVYTRSDLADLVCLANGEHSPLTLTPQKLKHFDEALLTGVQPKSGKVLLMPFGGPFRRNGVYFIQCYLSYF